MKKNCIVEFIIDLLIYLAMFYNWCGIKIYGRKEWIKKKLGTDKLK
jgi:hypothetical protein